MPKARPCDSSDDSCGSFVYLSLDVQEEEISGRTCRVCWDSSEASILISPCSCKGTQKYVHVKCLRRWQENVQKRDFRDERAYRCGVCREPYSLAPPDPRWTTRLWHLTRALAGAFCVILIAFGLAGPPWPHLALLTLVLMSTRSQGLLVMFLLAACTVLAALHSRGLRLVMRFDDVGRMGLAVVRHGQPIHGLGAGTLLVASDALENSIFSRAVVLVYSHGREGAKGVILTQPMGGSVSELLDDATAAAVLNASGVAAAAATPPKHFLGGPVGMPGEGARQEIAVLHTIRGVEGAAVVLPSVDGRPQLYQGGRLADVLELSSGVKSHRRGGNGNSATGGSPSPSVFVFHGISTWEQGQLEGEVRAGAWAFGSAFQDDVLSSEPEQLWAMLLSSSRVTWLA